MNKIYSQFIILLQSITIISHPIIYYAIQKQYDIFVLCYILQQISFNNFNNSNINTQNYQQYSLVHRMSKQQIEIVCVNALQMIINNGAKLAKDNKIVKNYLQTYANRNNIQITNQLVLQSGTAKLPIKIQQKMEDVPLSIKKDRRCFYSVNSSPYKLDTQKYQKRQDNSKSPKLSRRSSVQANQKLGKKTKQQSIDQKFIDISGLIQPKKNIKITQAMKNQQQYIDHLRNKNTSQEKMSQLQEKLQIQKQLKQQQRMLQLKTKFKKHMKSSKDNSFTYDLEGNQILFNNQNQQQSLRKKYPTSNLKYQFDEQEQPYFERQKDINIKQKAARGQAFASAVLKTMNLSKFSLNMTSKTCNIDQFAFMKRNDLFNNNHSRQVSTIPFFKISQGTKYTQANTNLSVSNKKTQRTAHSANKSTFINHKYSHLKQNADQNKTEMLEFDNFTDSIQKRRIQSSRPYIRPKTSVPHTARTTDRIVSVNQKLQFELIE